MTLSVSKELVTKTSGPPKIARKSRETTIEAQADFGEHWNVQH